MEVGKEILGGLRHRSWNVRAGNYYYYCVLFRVDPLVGGGRCECSQADANHVGSSASTPI